MNKKYEVFYFDGLFCREFVELKTDSFIKMILLLCKLKKHHSYVGVRIH